MAERVSCDECVVMRLFAEDERALPEDVKPLVPVVGEAAVAKFVKDESLFDQEVFAAKEVCPGWRPPNKALRVAAHIVDGQWGVDYFDRTHCDNPALKDEALMKRVGARRTAFEALVKTTVKAQRRSSKR